MEKVILFISGEEYIINTDEDPEYLIGLGKDLEKKMSALLRKSSRISTTQAAILTALQCLDEVKKNEKDTITNDDKIREYLEDAKRARTEAEVSKREAERLAKELARIKYQTK